MVWDRETIARPEALPALSAQGLSKAFDPFLDHFARETLRGGGEVELFRDRGMIWGVRLVHRAAGIASLFTPHAELAAEVRRTDPGLPLFAEHRLDPNAEPFAVLAGRLAELPDPGRSRHAVRPPAADEMPELLRLARELDGRVDEPWFRTAPPPNERGFVVAVGGQLAGQGWVSVVGEQARLHSLMVRPAFRRLGVASDLVAARLWWARASGAREVLTEIAEGNFASLRIAERTGLRERSRVYLHGLNEAVPPRPDPMR